MRLRLVLAAILPCLLATLAAAAAPEQLLQLTDAQRRTVGLAFEPVHAVGAHEMQAGQAGAGLQLSGQVVLPNSRQDVLLANVAGRVEAVLVNPGEKVGAGQVVARVYSAELLGMQRAYLAARSQADLAQARVRRDESLFNDGVIAESRLQASRADGAQAAAALLEQRQLLHLAGMGEAAVAALRTAEGMNPLLSITARRAGLVLQQTAKIGQQVDTGAPLMTIAALDLLWIDLQATRDQATRLGVGDRVELVGCAVAGRLIATGAQLDASSQTLFARAQFEGANACIAPNQFVQVSVSPARPAKGLVSVPVEAVVHRSSKDYVFVQEAKGLRAVEVAIERRQGAHAWLRKGPAVGTPVVITGVAALKGSWLGLGASADGAQ
jgi:multidrug efflux pump subunit AcrA (membrane-fusion protein)